MFGRIRILFAISSLGLIGAGCQSSEELPHQNTPTEEEKIGSEGRASDRTKPGELEAGILARWGPHDFYRFNADYALHLTSVRGSKQLVCAAANVSEVR